MSDNKIVVEYAMQITSTLNKHLAENPDCEHCQALLHELRNKDLD